ncbi:MAG TPA: DUF5719 family protein [Actinomycetota bacterium]|nr:DUF5719 family protein [Actinomycetota bacterium]
MREAWGATGRRAARWARAPRPTPRLPARMLVVALAFVVVGGLGVFLDRTVGRSASDAASSGELTSGAWFCPHGGGSSWRGWVIVGNPGGRRVSVRATTFGESGVLQEQSIAVPPRTQVYRTVPADETGAATEIEFFGGWVGAAFVVSAGGEEAGVAASECQGASRDDWFVMDQPTGPSESAYTVVMNPFFGPAEFDVVIRTPRRTVRPSVLSPYVLGPRRSVALRINRFALEAPGEETVTVEINQRIGRVVAGSLGVVPDGIRTEGGVGTRKRWLIPARATEPSTLLLVNPASLRAVLSGVAEEKASEQPLFEGKRLRLPPGAVAGEDLGAIDKAALVLESTNGREVATGVVVEAEKGDSAAIGGVLRPEEGWLVLPGTPPEGGRQLLILQNPARTEASVRVSFIGPDGPFVGREVGSVRVPGGRTVEMEIPAGPEGNPLTAVVEAERGTVVAAQTSYSGDDLGYASSVGLPMREEE